MDNTNLVRETFNEDIIKTEKKKYYANFMWKLMIAITVILTMQIIITVPYSVFFRVMDYLVERKSGDLLTAYEHLVRDGTINTIKAILTYVVLLISDAAGVLTLYLLCRKNMIKPEEPRKMRFLWWFVSFICCFGIGGVGSIIGGIVNVCLLLPGTVAGPILKTLLTGGNNVVENLLYADDSWLYIFSGIITVGIVAPIFEELIFRKFFIDSTRKYGIAASVLLSALAFGIFHGNFIQFFYAVGLGILFGYIYAATGKIRYTIFLHMGYNLYASALMPLARKMIPTRSMEEIKQAVDLLSHRLQTGMDIYASLNAYFDSIQRIISRNPIVVLGVMVTAMVNLFYFILIFAGIVFICVFLKKALTYRKTLMLGQKGTKRAAAFNWASILFWCLGAGVFALYYLLLNCAALYAAFM